jgi:glycosyltransferase involved in cell wall biosynthesis
MSRFDITAIINLHREGELARSSLLSLMSAKKSAEAQGLQVQVVAVLDKADLTTRNVCRDFEGDGMSTVHCSFGDLGSARNAGISAALGEWIAFLDGDDLWCDQWLVRAHGCAMTDNRCIVWHPEVSLYFGEKESIFVHIDMEDTSFDLANLALRNYWTALAFARRKLHVEIPYPKNDLNLQLGYEDWGWNVQTIAVGAIHKVVPGTVHSIRVKKLSMIQQAAEGRAMPLPSDLFRNEIVKGASMSFK